MFRVLISFAIIAIGTSAVAQQGRMGVGTGNLGLGLYYSSPSAAQWETKFGYHTGSPEFFDIGVNGVAASAESDFKSMSLVGDYYPIWGSGFRVSLGAFFSNSEIPLSFVADNGRSSVTIQGQSISVSPTNSNRGISGRIKMNTQKLIPYAGIGYTGLAGSSGFRINADAGVMFFKPSVQMAFGSAFDGDSAGKLRVQEAIFSHVESRTQFFPALSIGVDYSY